MPWLLCYDIADPARLRRIHRRMQGHATPMQYSVFWLESGTQARDACLEDVLPLVEADADDVRAHAMSERGFRLRLGAPALPAGIVCSAMPAGWWSGSVEAADEGEDES